MSETLIIKNVDLEELENHRLALGMLTVELARANNTGKMLKISEEQLLALDGVVNMLDSWSDEIYYQRLNEKEKT